MAKKRKVNRPQSTKNLAKDVIKPDMKRLDIPQAAKNEIARLATQLDTYIAGTVAGMGIKGPWSFDMKRMQVVVPKE